jgi:hypothetical protein
VKFVDAWGQHLVRSTWGFPPYGALAAELNFGNEGENGCGGLSQGEIGIIAGRNRMNAGRNRLPQRDNGRAQR